VKKVEEKIEEQNFYQNNKIMEGYVNQSIEDGLCTIEFYHPAHNSLPSSLLNKLVELINVASEDDLVKVILLKSGGEKTFCAGASFTELSSLNNFEEASKFFGGFANVINAIRKCKKIVVGRIHGKAIGGGVGISAACDYALATYHVSIKLSELAIGIGPFVIGPAVERKIGKSAFSQLALNPDEWQTADWAKQKGLFQEVFETTKQLDEYTDFYTKKLISYNPNALHSLKEVLWEGTSHWDELLNERASISGKLVLEEFTKKALEAFQNK
jgi:methylglutaconyl-CoA hydratase